MHQPQQSQPQSFAIVQDSYTESNPSALQYPYYPPYDNEVDFYEGAILRLDPQGVNKKVKSCPVCLIPIHILLISKPCQHYFCYECYQDNKIECGYCGSLNTEIIRVNDYEDIFTCEGHCFKVFENETELKNHLLAIEKLKEKKY